MTDFDKWLDEFEGYATRRERLLETFPEVPAKDLFIWLEASWKQGFLSGSGFGYDLGFKDGEVYQRGLN